MPGYIFQDHIIDAKIRLNNLGGYGAAGIIFQKSEETSYCLALISSKGYFRIDAVKDSVPRPLIAWTEISNFNGINIDLKIIAYDAFLVFIVNGKWLGEVTGVSAAYGQLGFAAASYEESEDTDERPQDSRRRKLKNNGYTCVAYLDYLSIDTRLKVIEENYKKYTDESVINAEERLRLAETFAVMGESAKALEQIQKAWKRRDEAISRVATADAVVRTRKELLLAARLSFNLGQYSEADNFIDTLLEQGSNSAEGKVAYTEKLKILYELNKFEELKTFAVKNNMSVNKDADYYMLTARSHWELKEYKESAEAWDAAFETNKENGIYAANAGNAYEFAGNKKAALARFIDAGKIFLNQGNNAELEALMPKLLNLGKRNWEARTLAGKWSFSIEDYDRSAEEFAKAHKIRIALKSQPKPDPAAYYLWALVLNLKGKDKDAIRLLEKTVELAPDYGLFRFKLAEIKLKTGKKDQKIAEELKLALKYIEEDQTNTEVSLKEMANYAGNLLQSAGDAQNADYFFTLAESKR